MQENIDLSFQKTKKVDLSKKKIYRAQTKSDHIRPLHHFH